MVLVSHLHAIMFHDFLSPLFFPPPPAPPLPFCAPAPPFFLAWPSISRCPTLSPSIASVCAVRPAVYFLLILSCLSSLAFFGVMVRDPFFVTPLVEEEEDALAVGLDGFLTWPWAIFVRDVLLYHECWKIHQGVRLEHCSRQETWTPENGDGRKIRVAGLNVTCAYMDEAVRG